MGRTEWYPHPPVFLLRTSLELKREFDRSFWAWLYLSQVFTFCLTPSCLSLCLLASSLSYFCSSQHIPKSGPAASALACGKTGNCPHLCSSSCQCHQTQGPLFTININILFALPTGRTKAWHSVRATWDRSTFASHHLLLFSKNPLL